MNQVAASEPEKKLAPKPRNKRPVKQQVNKLKTNRRELADFKRQFHSITPEAAHSVEDTLKPEYWAHVAPNFRIGDRIEAIWEDGSKFLEYTVMETGEAWVKVVVINEVKLTKDGKAEQKDEVEVKQDYKAKYINRHSGWGVIRTSDNVRLEENLDSKEAAENWISEYKGKVIGT